MLSRGLQQEQTSAVQQQRGQAGGERRERQAAPEEVLLAERGCRADQDQESAVESERRGAQQVERQPRRQTRRRAFRHATQHAPGQHHQQRQVGARAVGDLGQDGALQQRGERNRINPNANCNGLRPPLDRIANDVEALEPVHFDRWLQQRLLKQIAVPPADLNHLAHRQAFREDPAKIGRDYQVPRHESIALRDLFH